MLIRIVKKPTISRPEILVLAAFLVLSVLVAAPHDCIAAEQNSTVTTTSCPPPPLLWLAKISMAGMLILVSFSLVFQFFSHWSQNSTTAQPGFNVYPHPYPHAWIAPMVVAQPVMMPSFHPGYQRAVPTPAQMPADAWHGQPASCSEPSSKSTPEEPPPSGRKASPLEECRFQRSSRQTKSRGARRSFKTPKSQQESRGRPHASDSGDTEMGLAKHGFEIVRQTKTSSSLETEIRPQASNGYDAHADHRLADSILQENLKILRTTDARFESIKKMGQTGQNGKNI
jgi:hypothetical protein